jgi:hypothetical protein
MTKRDRKQSGGINAENSHLTIGGDAVGRDKIETHEHYGEEPYQELEEFYAGGCLSRTLIVVGTIILVAGILTFFGAVLYGFTAQSFEASAAIAPFAAVGFGTVMVGGIILSVGRVMARNSAYRQRVSSRRR